MYFSIISLSIVISFIVSLSIYFIVFFHKKRKYKSINKRFFTIILISIIILFYIFLSIERLVILNRYDLFSDHVVEMILEFRANNKRYPMTISEIKYTSRFQHYKNNILFKIRPEFGFISESNNDTLKYTFCTNHYRRKLNEKVNFSYKYAFNPVFFKDLILSNSWVRIKSDEELFNELENIKNFP